jgi:speckle-type POZ protein
MLAEQQKACNVVVFHAQEANSFNLRVNNTATKYLPADHCIETDVPVPAAAGFRCTTKYWPHWAPSKMRISVVITRTHDNERHKVVTGHIDLPSRSGAPVPHMTLVREPVAATRDGCVGGICLTAKRTDVEASCVADDHHFTAVCMVSVSRGWLWPPLPLPTPSGLDHDILAMSDLTDVSFQVDGETFRAHSLVLAARSPVFKAELYGEMAEGKAASSVTNRDMRAPTFKSMLEYMYHGLLPVPAAAAPDGNASRKMEFQHLYAAADRYGLDTLKEMCEEVLCASVSVSTVLSNLVFAEERISLSRTCLKLKSRCLDFLASGENFKEVAVTNEYVDIMKDAPSLLAEVQNWFKKPRLS